MPAETLGIYAAGLAVIEQDEDGVWCAHAQLRPQVGAHGEGETREAAIADLRAALTAVAEESGMPDEPTVNLTGP